MAVQNTQLPITAAYTLVGDDTAAITLQNLNSDTVEIVGTATNTQPAASARGAILLPFTGVSVTLADFFRGVTTPRYVWARTTNVTQGVVWVSHA